MKWGERNRERRKAEDVRKRQRRREKFGTDYEEGSAGIREELNRRDKGKKRTEGGIKEEKANKKYVSTKILLTEERQKEKRNREERRENIKRKLIDNS